MRIVKPAAAAAAVSLLVAGLAVASATSASAAFNGPKLPGSIYLLNTKTAPGNNLDTATQANVITSGTNATRPWQAYAVDGTCPAGTAQTVVRVRIPQAGVDPESWDETPMTAPAVTQDSHGRWYNTGNSSPMTAAKVAQYVTDQGGQATLPLIVTCLAADTTALGYFESSVTVVGSDSSGTWSVPAPSWPPAGGGSSSPAAATTTSLTAAAAGVDLKLTATVSPAAATGTVTFAEGGTTLGTAPVSGGTATFTVTKPALGAHTYGASFAPADTSAYQPSTAPAVPLTVGQQDGSGNITVTLTVPDAPVVDGSLTLTVPSAGVVALAGQRDTGNTRITATATLPGITVTDTRRDGLLTAWQVNVQAADFSGGSTPVGAKYLGWTPALPQITKDAGAPLVVQAGPEVASALDDASGSGLSTSRLLGQTTTVGRGTTSLGGQLNLALPSSTAAGSYSSTITVTLIGG